MHTRKKTYLVEYAVPHVSGKNIIHYIAYPVFDGIGDKSPSSSIIDELPLEMKRSKAKHDRESFAMCNILAQLNGYLPTGVVCETPYFLDEDRKWQPYSTAKPLKKKYKNILTAQANHSLIDCLAELKWSRPIAAQEFLDECIELAKKRFPVQPKKAKP